MATGRTPGAAAPPFLPELTWQWAVLGMLFAAALLLNLLIPPAAPIHPNTHGIQEIRTILDPSVPIATGEFYGPLYVSFMRFVCIFGGWQEGAAAQPPEAQVSLERGRRAWLVHCAPCHGREGGGNGPAARFLEPPPRDLTRGEYKWRSTASGALPTDADILRTIDEGAPGSAMPSWRTRLPESTRHSLVAWVKTFSPRFHSEDPLADPPVEVPPMPAEATRLSDGGTQLLDAGKATWKRLKCWDCHGDGGRGDGPSTTGMKDSQGRRIAPNDLVKGVFRAGDSAEAVYRTLMTGLNGTPMPSYQPTTTPAERWPLVLYVRSLRRPRTWIDTLFAPLQEQTR